MRNISPTMPITRVGAGATHIGQRRTVNQDAFLFDDDFGVYIVADGMGGHAAGEIASKEAVDTVMGMLLREKEALARVRGGDISNEAMYAAVRAAESSVQAATYMVFGLAQDDPSRKGMGTTVSCLVICGEVGITAQVGDSRIYLVRGHHATRLTEDHTLVAWQLKQGIITEAEAAVSPNRNVITRAVGSREYVQVDMSVFDVKRGDTFVLCSDGLHGYVVDEEIPQVLAKRGPSDAAEEFVRIANQRGGRDNITAVVVSLIDKDSARPLLPSQR